MTKPDTKKIPGATRKRKNQRPVFGPLHPWRECPTGQHWVRPHARKGTKGVKGFCRNNPSGRDQIYLPEINKIADAEFQKLTGSPCSYDLGFSNGNDYDSLIRGWTKYWNEIFQPVDPLDADLVKALIATESGFRVNIKRRAGKQAGWARGLLQVTDWTLEILQDEEGELRDHLVNVDQRDMSAPGANIVAGIRWLFRKRETASARLGRQASWEEAAADYKSYLTDVIKGKVPRSMRDLQTYYERLKEKCKEPTG